MLTPTVYEGFEAVIREREARSETAETRFLSIDATGITAAEFHGKMVHITVRFVSEFVSTTRDRNGKVIDGSTDNVATSPTCGLSPEMSRRAIPTGSWPPPEPERDGSRPTNATLLAC